MSPGHFAPGGSAHATIPFRQSPAAAFPAAAGTSPWADDLHAGMKSRGAPLPLLASWGLPGWLPAWGFVSAEPKDSAHGSPPGKMMLSAENIGDFPLKRASTHACCWRSPATKCPRGRQRAGSGAGPRQHRLPPRGPGLRSVSVTAGYPDDHMLRLLRRTCSPASRMTISRIMVPSAVSGGHRTCGAPPVWGFVTRAGAILDE